MLQLFKHQEEDVKRLLHILSDKQGAQDLSETGTGKTAKLLTIMNEIGLPRNRYNLVTVPASTILKWRDEVETWTGFRPVPIYGTRSRRDKLITDLQKNGGVGIIGHEAYILHEEAFTENTPFIKAVDEAHKAKNPKTRFAQSIKRGKDAYRYDMTATPMDSKPFELWSMLNFLDPVTFGPKPRNYLGKKEYWNYWKFAQEFCVYAKGRFSKWEYVGERKSKLSELHAMLAEYGVRRFSRDVYPWMPQVIPNRVPIIPTPRQWQMHESIRKHLMVRRSDDTLLIAKNEASQLIRMLQILSNPAIVGDKDESPKDEYVLELLEHTRPIAVFSRFKQTLYITQKKLERAGYKVGMITGDESAKQRHTVNKALNDGSIDVCLCTYGAGGAGIDFLIPRMVMYDQPWEYINWEQAQGRIKRPNNPHMKHMQIDVLATDNTVEDYVWRLLGNKTDVNERVLIRMLNGLAA